MDDLISRAEYKREIDEQLRFYDVDSSPFHVKILELQRELLDSMPAVDAAPVIHGHIKIEATWMGGEDCGCSVCGHMTLAPDYKFCPYCGAKFDEVIEDEE